jgi:hypothetical protein
LRVLSLWPRSMIRPGRFRARLTYLWLLLLYPRLLGTYLRTLWPDVPRDATMMAGRNKPLRGLSPMWRDIFGHRRFFNTFFLLRSILLILRSLTGIWSYVTNNPTLMTIRQASSFGMRYDRHCRFNVSILTRKNHCLPFVLTGILRLCNFRLQKDNLRRRGNVRNIRNISSFNKA